MQAEPWPFLEAQDEAISFAAASVDHLRRYVEHLFRSAIRRGKENA
jgi:hypothetical protein